MKNYSVNIINYSPCLGQGHKEGGMGRDREKSSRDQENREGKEEKKKHTRRNSKSNVPY